MSIRTLSNNQISYLTSGTFTELSALERLYFAHGSQLASESDADRSQICELQSDQQPCHRDLHRIVCINDLVRGIMVGKLLCCLTRTSIRGLNLNQIRSLANGTFMGLPALRELYTALWVATRCLMSTRYLQYNQISSVAIGTFTELSSLKQL